MTGTVRVDASRVRAGDILVVLGTAHRVSRVTPYEHPAWPGEAWAVAWEDATGWCIALIPGQALEGAA
jgi:hypothetical protein